MENKYKEGFGKRKIVIQLFCVVGTLILLTLSLFTFGWFTDSQSVAENGLGMTAASAKFELAAENKSGQYDSLLDIPQGTELNNISVDGEATPKNLTATSSEKPEIKWQMSDESNFGNVSGNGIQPGSSGKLTFYVIAKQSGSLKLTFNLDTILYDKTAAAIDESNPNNSAHIIADTDTAAKLVKGHILFFKQKNDDIYAERITDTFTFEKIDAAADMAYRVDIYWVWPEVIDQLVLPEEDNLLTSKDIKRVMAAGESIIPTDITNEQQSDYFVDTLQNLQAMLDNVSKGSGDTNFDTEYYKTLNTEWNKADQQIGITVGYIQLRLTAEEQAA